MHASFRFRNSIPSLLPWLGILGLCGLGTGLIACEDRSGTTVGTASDDTLRAALRERFASRLERGFNAEDRQRVLQDLETLIGRQLRIDSQDSSPSAKNVSAVFGGSEPIQLLRFLDERIHYLFPPSSDPAVDISPQTTLFENPSIVAPSITLARNFSAPLWFTQLQQPGMEVFLRFNDQKIRVRTARIGAIRLERGYFELAQNRANATSLWRLSTLFHEARHSDCTGGINSADARRIKNRQNPLNPNCGHQHSICPATITLNDGTPEPHPYAGLPACDAHAWGANSIQAVFALAYAHHCPTCTETERQEILMLVADRMLRLGELAKQLRLGTLGTPDLSSTDRVESEDTQVENREGRR